MSYSLFSARLVRACWLLAVLAFMAACSSDPSESSAIAPLAEPDRGESSAVSEPPRAETRQHIVTAPAGEREDPWYWLRDDEREDADVLAYLNAENDYKEAMLAHVSEFRNDLFDELRGRIVEDDSSVPVFDRGYWYYTRFEAGLEYPIHARREGSMAAAEEILLDVNALADGHDYYQIGDRDVSLNNQRLAYLEDAVGRRQYRIKIKDLTTGETINTGIVGVSSVSWSADNRHLFFVSNHPETLRSWQVRRLDTAAETAGEGEVMYQEDDTAFYTGVGRSTSNDWNIIYLASTVSSEMHVLPSDQPEGEFQLFYPRERDHEYIADHLDDRWIIRTNYQAPNFRIMQVELDHHADREQWQDVVAHSNEIYIHDMEVMESFLAISERSDGLRRIRIHDWSSDESTLLAFDEPAYAAYLGANPDQRSSTLRYVYSSMTTPSQTWDLDVASGERKLLKQEQVASEFDADDYVTRRLKVPVRDGVKVPVSLMHHRLTALDGSAPLYQYAYGSYGSSSEPVFNANRLSLVDRGFVFAIAHVRGGQEMGRDWYDQGRMLNKKNTFHDFIDLTAYLIEQKLVDPDRVFAMGASAGGLLMGAVANLAPDYYTGIVAHVPFVDVVTTMLDESIPLTTNEFDEWGNPMDPEYYEYMLSYSPYDNVSAQDYPAILVTTGLWDSQVQYWEPAKWVARLRATRTDDNLLLLHTNMEAGHGGASGRFRRLEQTALEYTFVLDLAGLVDASD